MIESFREARRVLDAFLGDEALLRRCAAVGELLHRRFCDGRKVLACGNGGSACDAAHFAEELTGRFRAPPPGCEDRAPLPALACTDTGHITCTANDYGFDAVFERWVRALGQSGDVLVLLSTSGNSENIVRAARAGRERGMTTVALLGRGGGRLAGVCDHEIIVPGETSDRIQELHMLILHAWVEDVERRLREGDRVCG
jgi:D-sedoheptulose 7-phosphate isomerase